MSLLGVMLQDLRLYVSIWAPWKAYSEEDKVGL
jgi:hypothetical protein